MMDRSKFEKSEIECSIPVRFEKMVQLHSERLAVKGENFSFTYRELNNLSDRIACSILKHPNQNQKLLETAEPVAIIFDHDALVIAAILGVLKSGRMFFALERNHPIERNKSILDDLQTGLILADDKNYGFADDLANGSCQIIRVEAGDFFKEDKKPGIVTGPETIAAIHFTSGSTGKPKGVYRNHQFILHRIWYETNEYGIGPQDRISLIHDVGFGASEPDIFGALLNGAALCMFDLKKYGLQPLIPWLKDEKITFFHAPSDLFRIFLDLLSEHDSFPALRQVTPSGRLFRKDVELISKHVPTACRIIQRLSSSETGMVTRYVIDPAEEIKTNVLPVGFPIPDKEVFIIDEEGNRLGVDQVGEIAVRSRYLVSGYWGEPELTEKLFISDPTDNAVKTFHMGDIGRLKPDGCLELLGRKDSRIKIRGFRVETGEIEAVLLDYDNVKEVVVIPEDLGDGNNRLIAYLVTEDHYEIRASELRSFVNQKLPDFMLPDVFIFLEKIPLNERNKIDLKALPVPNKTRSDLVETYCAPSTFTEETVAQIWSEVLKFSPIGVEDNFFGLGGESLSAIRMISRIKSTFQVEIPLKAVFESPTVSAFARVVEEATRKDKSQSTLDLKTSIKLLGFD